MIYVPVNLDMNKRGVLFYILVSFGIAVSSQISIPLPNGVPLTMQTFAMAFLGYSLSSKKGVHAVLSYLLLGAIGLPVFAQGKGGILSLFGLTGGFLFGFLFLVYFCSKAKTASSFLKKVGFSLLGIFLCHALGVLQYSLITGISFVEATCLVSIPFLLKDILSVAFAFVTVSGIDFIKNYRKSL